MSTQNDGGQAFPFMGNVCFSTGMTLRDYFAAKTMAGMLSNNDTNVRNLFENSVAQSHLAQMVYSIADAMLAAREASK